MDKEHEEAGTFDVKSKLAMLLGSGKEMITSTSMGDVGKLLIAAVKTPSVESPRVLKVHSFIMTPKKILSRFEKQKRSTLDVSYTNLVQLKQLEKQAWETQNPLAAVYTLRRICSKGGTFYQAMEKAKVSDPQIETRKE
ncbi:uncharacterized protein BDR25DRAFT_312634 [Lindgomyces ingoldianus]|uniref:Uncharacterized protein n=1 Tax=Lindgomyces ingoldianus TaxID=673940 RepID=A0ACB6R320_9PLEO|nr:uncharacterized protein BDR25DRAFT_312634 [Lindgomyces ingoldianus]KAF2472717.1 hypothetical protein BDR25DRAFT_312634 [Lindgomyces ingoldianus]